MKQAGRTLVVFEINSGGRSAISFFHNHGFKETDGWNLAAAGAIAIFQVLDSHARAARTRIKLPTCASKLYFLH